MDLGNNFKEYGFTGNFEGIIIQQLDSGIHLGYVVIDGDEYSATWDKDGYCIENDMHNLKPIKREWYENPDNIGKIIFYDVFDKEELGVFKKYKDNWVSFISLDSGQTFEQKAYKVRPATKEEVLSLVIKI